MFDLEARIREWQRTLTGQLAKEPLDELESHLREEMHRAALAGRPLEAAWIDAVARLGSADRLASEFAKIAPVRPLRWAAAWIVFGVYVILTSGLVCPMLANLREHDASSLLLGNVAMASTGYFAVFAFGVLSAWLALQRLWGGATRRRVACLRWWGQAFAIVGFFGCLTAFVLGSMWTKERFDAYWSNDPVEFGAVALVLWNGFALACFRRHRTPGRIDLALGLTGSLVLGLCWFGPVLVAAQGSTPLRTLHNYGGIPAWWIAFLATYFTIHLALLTLALVPIGRRESTLPEASV
jgi:hypothetical protein